MITNPETARLVSDTIQRVRAELKEIFRKRVCRLQQGAVSDSSSPRCRHRATNLLTASRSCAEVVGDDWRYIPISRSNSKTASLHPECKQTYAVHAPSAYTHNSTPFSSQWVGRRPLSNSKPLNERPSTGRQLSGLALLRLTGALVIHAPELPPSGIGPFLNDDRARAMMFRLPRGKSFCHGKLAGGRGHLLPATCPTPLIMERWLSAGLCGRLRADAFAGATYLTHSAYLSLSNSRFAGHHTE